MTHSLSVPDWLWQWARQQAGEGASVGAWLRNHLAESAMTQLMAARTNDKPVPPDAHVVAAYLGDYWQPTIRRDGESSCNHCSVMLSAYEFVIAQHLRRADGSRVTHYFHPWHVPQAGPVALNREGAR